MCVYVLSVRFDTNQMCAHIYVVSFSEISSLRSLSFMLQSLECAVCFIYSKCVLFFGYIYI